RVSASRVETRILEVEIALDEVHDVVVDLPLTPEVDDRSPLGVETLAPSPLVVLRSLLDRAVVAVVEARREAVLTGAVEAAHALSCVLAHPVFGNELVQALHRRTSGVDARLRLLLGGAAVVLEIEQPDNER